MKFLLYLALIGAAAYGITYYVPAETRQQALGAIGLASFFQETLPTYLRAKLTIPENPVEKRQRLLGELSRAIGTIDEELEAVAPSAGALPTPAPGTSARPKAADAPKSPPPAEIRERVEKTRELLNQSEAVLQELEKANPQQGFIAKATERILDKILPPPPTARATDGIGGDPGGKPLCPQ